jgi:hypothetical protein
MFLFETEQAKACSIENDVRSAQWFPIKNAFAYLILREDKNFLITL